MQNTSKAIISQARTWLGTPFHHQGRVKGVGVDCIGLVVGVLRELGVTDANGQLLSDYDDTNYSITPDGYSLKAILQQHLKPVPLDKIRPADILLFRFGRNPQHVGFATDHKSGGLGIIHCYSSAACVVEHRLDEKWRKMLVAAYSLKK